MASHSSATTQVVSEAERRSTLGDQTLEMSQTWAELDFFLFRRKLYLLHPAFSVYISTTMLQSLLGSWASHHWGGRSMQYFGFAWGAQGVVICVRWLALIEIARRVLTAYSGIWKLVNAILFILCIVILVYSVAVPRTRWDLIVLSADRAVEFCIASFVVGLLAHQLNDRLNHLLRSGDARS